ncbi:MAG TPA: hypothetical protein VFH68_25355 [Polyangia bacterium]|jgi:hypothetical protein|nr:hypothetical protein [Polyangia bacterium]
MAGVMVLGLGVGVGCAGGLDAGVGTPEGNLADGGSSRPRCHAPAGFSGSPRSSQDAVALLNALPKPTSAACFVESLDRPLSIFATSSTISAQPALSPRSPRVFLRLDELVLSVAIDGDSSRKIEFSDLIAGDTRSIKGELLLPLSEPVARGALYDGVLSGTGTVCGFCHSNEEPAAMVDFPQAYSSLAFRPNVRYQVPLTTLAHENQVCDRDTEPARCEMLSAIFGGGDVIEARFSEAMTLFY